MSPVKFKNQNSNFSQVLLFVELKIATHLNHQEILDVFLKTRSWPLRKISILTLIRVKLAKWNTTENIIEKDKQEKIFPLSKLIDVSSIGCTIVYTNTSSLRELSMGVSICLERVLMNSLNNFKTKVLMP
jgi:hypothetical protein